jgi:hypothetical protein
MAEVIFLVIVGVPLLVVLSVIVYIFVIAPIMNVLVRTRRSPKPKSEIDKIREALVRECGPAIRPVKVLTMDDAIRLTGELASEGVHITAAKLLSRARTNGFRTASSQKNMHGDINPITECIFCGATGGVRVKVGSVTEEYRMKNSPANVVGVTANVLGLAISSQKSKIEKHCDKCGKTWHD